MLKTWVPIILGLVIAAQVVLLTGADLVQACLAFLVVFAIVTTFVDGE